MRRKTIKFSVPLKVRVSKNKMFTLNLNQYRNEHYRVLSTAKRNYNDIIKDIAPKIDYTIQECDITFKYYHPTRGSYDTSNPCCVIDKFTLDALTKIRYWEDDDYKTVQNIHYEPHGHDKDNPRCDVIIKVKKYKPYDTKPKRKRKSSKKPNRSKSRTTRRRSVSNVK